MSKEQVNSDKLVLRAILQAINACESVELLRNNVSSAPSREMRSELFDFKNELGRRYETNKELQKFDAVFKGCGWDDQGLRWTREHKDDEEDIFIVEFKDDKHTKWRIA